MSLFRPLDVIVLLIIFSSAYDLPRKKSIEAVFKNKIKSGHFTELLIKDTFVTLKVVSINIS